MIKPEDAQFHQPDKAELSWAETNFFGFYNAEAHLNIGVYALFRTNLGIVSSTICMNSGQCITPWEADFSDLRATIPIPPSRNLLDYALPNGLSVRCIKPNMDWKIDYDDGEETRIDVEYRSLMPPFDIHDPAMDPMAASKSEEGKFAWGTAYNGHFDQTGQVRGSIAIRGRRYPIDCISTMDHSWGPRPERGAPNMSWLHAHFSKDLAIHGIFAFDAATKGRHLALTHGYVLERGQVFGLKAGYGKTVRKVDRYAASVELALTDSRGREWRLEAEGLTTFPWQCWANMVAFNVLARWRCGALTGYGEIMDFFEVPQLTALNGTLSAHTRSASIGET